MIAAFLAFVTQYISNFTIFYIVFGLTFAFPLSAPEKPGVCLAGKPMSKFFSRFIG